MVAVKTGLGYFLLFGFLCQCMRVLLPVELVSGDLIEKLKFFGGDVLIITGLQADRLLARAYGFPCEDPSGGAQGVPTASAAVTAPPGCWYGEQLGWQGGAAFSYAAYAPSGFYDDVWASREDQAQVPARSHEAEEEGQGQRQGQDAQAQVQGWQEGEEEALFPPREVSEEGAAEREGDASDAASSRHLRAEGPIREGLAQERAHHTWANQRDDESERAASSTRSARTNGADSTSATAAASSTTKAAVKQFKQEFTTEERQERRRLRRMRKKEKKQERKEMEELNALEQQLRASARAGEGSRCEYYVLDSTLEQDEEAEGDQGGGAEGPDGLGDSALPGLRLGGKASGCRADDHEQPLHEREGGEHEHALREGGGNSTDRADGGVRDLSPRDL
eukprot:1022229-Pyramimonas_sp.AAC.1